MGSIETVVKYSKEIESLLEFKFSANGNGLIEKVKSIDWKLDNDIQTRIKKIGRIRNKVVHDADYELKNKDHFINECDEILEVLNEMSSDKSFNHSSDEKRSDRLNDELERTLQLCYPNVFLKALASLFWIIEIFVLLNICILAVVVYQFLSLDLDFDLFSIFIFYLGYMIDIESFYEVLDYDSLAVLLFILFIYANRNFLKKRALDKKVLDPLGLTLNQALSGEDLDGIAAKLIGTEPDHGWRGFQVLSPKKHLEHMEDAYLILDSNNYIKAVFLIFPIRFDAFNGSGEKAIYLKRLIKKKYSGAKKFSISQRFPFMNGYDRFQVGDCYVVLDCRAFKRKTSDICLSYIDINFSKQYLKFVFSTSSNNKSRDYDSV